MLHSWSKQSESLLHVFVQQCCKVLLAQFMCPQTRDPSHSESMPQSPSPSLQRVVVQYSFGHKLHDFLQFSCMYSTYEWVQSPATAQVWQSAWTSWQSDSPKHHTKTWIPVTLFIKARGLPARCWGNRNRDWDFKSHWDYILVWVLKSLFGHEKEVSVIKGSFWCPTESRQLW